MTNKVKVIEDWIDEMEFNGESMVVTREQARDFLTNIMVDIEWNQTNGSTNRAIGIVQGVVAVTAGVAVGALVVTAGNKLKLKFKKDKDES